MSRYEAVHAEPSGPGDARPTAAQIVEDEGVAGKLQGKIIVVTGVSSGIGIETVRALAPTGATFYLLARDLNKAEKALADFFDPSRMELVQMDLESFASVREAATTILGKTDKINILINNAGIMAVPDLRLTKDGHELQFGTNHLAHFLFFELLKPALLAGVADDFHSRVVNVSSTAHLMAGINDSDNYNYKKGEYTPWGAYGQSKTANIYMANEIERRYGARGLHATSLHPGGIQTGLSKFVPAEVVQSMLADRDLIKSIKSPEQGAATTVWAAIGQEWATKGGKYLVDCTVGKPAPDAQTTWGPYYASWAYDVEKATRLWEDSLRIVGVEETA
ncbi:retinol dehydrogenase [Plectosphaerella plurivora]|uniref:Retinol dehydrogenase n=1 Tax=Plectosphaerella plurivora TaxID=936078 RepID=A0A9P9A8Y6_9PEZI|nr:retinol dehydrogenase [Plectosphaerella plurivora]